MKKILLLSLLMIMSKYIFAQTQKEIYASPHLVITQLSDHTYMHTSYLNTNDFGKVSCNGMIVYDHQEVIIFDTPANDSSALALIHWINHNLHAKIIAIIPTHFHNDCLGGLAVFHKKHIPSYAYTKTIQIAKEKHLPVPQHGFDTTLLLSVGKEKVYAQFLGEGHTQDNIIGYFPKEKTMFGGCLIKELGAGKGNLEDANTNAWANSVTLLKAKYPDVQIIIPGHGKPGNQQLLDYTIQLFQ